MGIAMVLGGLIIGYLSTRKAKGFSRFILFILTSAFWTFALLTVYMVSGV